MERPFTVVLLSEWVEDDVDHSELIISRVDGVIHSALLLARVHLVFGLGFHNLVKHMLIRVSRITESEQVPGQYDSIFRSG